jgi:hypothetical protein
MAIASEQGRIYRSTINGLISTADGARLTYQLKEMRCTREAIALEVEAAAKNAPVVPKKVDISIISVPSGCFVSEAQRQEIENGKFLQTIEHERISLADYTERATQQTLAEPQIEPERVSLDDDAGQAAELAAVTRALDEAITEATRNRTVSPEAAALLSEITDFTRKLAAQCDEPEPVANFANPAPHSPPGGVRTASPSKKVRR